MVAHVSRKTGLCEAQVYKWGWDQKRKKVSEDGSFVLPSTDEFGGYSKHGFSGLDSISAALGIDIDSKIRELHLDLGRVSGEREKRGRSSSEKARASKDRL